MLTVGLVLAAAAILTVLIHAGTGKCPLWVPVFILAVWALLQQMPAK